MPPDRLLAFSDGVFAFAITLLVLSIHVPSMQDLATNRQTLAEALVQQRPNYISFLVSFLIVGVVWGNHHVMFSYIKRANHLLVVLILLNVVLLPFAAAILAEYIATPQQQTAVLPYSGLLTIGGVFFNLTWWYASSGHRHLDRELPGQVVRHLRRRYIVGPLFYGLAFLLSSVWNGIPGLVLCGFLAILYLLPTVADRVQTPVRRKERSKDGLNPTSQRKKSA